MRRIQFENNKFYHIYNRGVDKKFIFIDENDFLRFIWNLRLLNNDTTKKERKSFYLELSGKEPGSGAPEPGSGTFTYSKELIQYLNWINKRKKLVEIIAYCLIKNHFHLLLKQLQRNGISKFMHKIGLAYTHYFNLKNKRRGVLFQGKFKSSDNLDKNRILETSAYINANSEIHRTCPAEKWPWSSYFDYIGIRNGRIPDKQAVLNNFESIAEYEDFVKMYIEKSVIETNGYYLE